MKNTDGRLRARIIWVLCFFIIAFGVVFLKAFSLQVLDGHRLRERAKNQYERTVVIPSKRGGIFDRNNEELAVSIEVDSVYARPKNVEDIVKASLSLSPVLSVGSAELKSRLHSGRPFVWLKRQIDLKDEERKFIESIKGVGSVKESRRFYPNHVFGAPIVGFTGVDGGGLEGVELYYDKYLKGSSLSVKAGKDATGRILLFDDVEEGVQGGDVLLTLDKKIQYIAEKELKKAVEKYGARAGTAVVMDPFTGAVLAMANVPSFDPNDYGKFKPHDWRNRAITDSFEPGSTIKPVLLAAALDEGVVKMTDTFFCENGSYRVADRTFHDTKKHGMLSVKEIIKYSSNIGAAKIGEKLGNERYFRHLKSFGFGEKIGIDLPGEAGGSLNHYKKWSGVTIDTISFGQGIAVTALQLTAAISAVANGGFLMRPSLVKEIRNSDGKVVAEFNPVIVRRVMSADTAEKVRDALISVTEPGGTGELASLGKDFKVAGKTGTAQKPDFKEGGYETGKYMASFAGFLPAEKPRLTIFVILDEPRGEFYGGAVAAPVFRAIARESLAYLGVFPDGLNDGLNPVAEPGARILEARGDDPRYGAEVKSKEVKPKNDFDPRLIPARAGYGGPLYRAPDFKGKTVRAVLKAAREGFLDVDIEGSGRAETQSPGAGFPMPKDGVITVGFR